MQVYIFVWFIMIDLLFILIYFHAVYLAIKVSIPLETAPPGQMSFLKVYNGSSPNCVISSAYMNTAFLDRLNNKPAYILRIAARNIKGYGPATQIRWLQDNYSVPALPPQVSASSRKRSNSQLSSGSEV